MQSELNRWSSGRYTISPSATHRPALHFLTAVYKLQSVPSAEEEADCRTLARDIEGVCLRVDESHSTGNSEGSERVILTPEQRALIGARFEPLNALLGFGTHPSPA